MTLTAKFIFTLGTTFLLLFLTYLLFSLYPQISRTPPLNGVFRLIYDDIGTRERVTTVIYPGENGIDQRIASRIPDRSPIISHVAGVMTGQDIVNPSGTYTAAVTSRTCSNDGCTGKNALKIKWKYSPFTRTVLDGIVITSFYWLDDYHLLIAGTGTIVVMDIAGKMLLTIPGANVALNQSN